MKYIEVSFTVSPISETANDIIAALAMEQGFESFVESPDGTASHPHRLPYGGHHHHLHC